MQRANPLWRIVLCSATLAGLFAVVAAPPASAATRSSFAGYITSPTTITSTADSVTLPTFACTRRTAAVTAVATVYDSTGALFSSAMVYVGCSQKHETLVALAEINSSFSTPAVTMNPGDVVALSTTCGATGISISIHDETTGSIGTASSATAEICTQAEAGDGAVANGSHLVALPPFGMLDFTSVMVNGSALGTFAPAVSNYAEGKRNVVTTGALTGDGTTFTTTKGP